MKKFKTRENNKKKKPFWDVIIKADNIGEAERKLDKMLDEGELVVDKEGRFVKPKKKTK